MAKVNCWLRKQSLCPASHVTVCIPTLKSLSTWGDTLFFPSQYVDPGLSPQRTPLPLPLPLLPLSFYFVSFPLLAVWFQSEREVLLAEQWQNEYVDCYNFRQIFEMNNEFPLFHYKVKRNAKPSVAAGGASTGVSGVWLMFPTDLNTTWKYTGIKMEIVEMYTIWCGRC